MTGYEIAITVLAVLLALSLGVVLEYGLRLTRQISEARHRLASFEAWAEKAGGWRNSVEEESERLGKPAAIMLYAQREHFLSLVPCDEPVLEIGPFTSPMLSGSNVKYFDVMERDALVERAKTHGFDYSHTPKIDFVGSYPVDQTFAAVVSSHCIEHQPDLVHHLNEVERILDQAGAYYLIIPDKRYCFDHFLPESSIADVLEAHLDKRQHHRAGSVIEHRTLVAHNEPARHWAGDHGEVQCDLPRIKDALAEIKRGGYIDVHAWQFTPASFNSICRTLFDLGLTGLAPFAVFETPRDRHEFTAILARPTFQSQSPPRPASAA